MKTVYYFRVEYIEDNKHKKEKYFENVKDITKAFNITKELVQNIYSNIHGVSHPEIIKIEKLPNPIKCEKKILISFD